MTWVAGADGCRAGWIVVLRELGTARTDAVLVPSFRELLELAQAPRVIAIDVPIGLASGAQPGGRTCEIAARNYWSRFNQELGVPAAGFFDEAVCALPVTPPAAAPGPRP